MNFALMMSQMEGGCPVDYNTITDLFLQVQRLLIIFLFLFFILRLAPKGIFHFFEQCDIISWTLEVGHGCLCCQAVYNSPNSVSLTFLLISTYLFTGREFCFLCLLQRNLIREATAFLLDVLKPNQPEHAFLQTKVNSIWGQKGG